MKGVTEKKREELRTEEGDLTFDQEQRCTPYVSSDRISNGHEGDFLMFDCCIAQS